MDAITIEAKERGVGKKAARDIRRAGNVPCVLYGHHTEPISFQLPELALHQFIYTSETHIIEIKLDGKRFECIMKSADFHPVTDRPIHADFQVLEKGEKVSLTVPVQYHGTPVGQKEGGDTQVVLHEVEIRCFPQDIPSHIDVDISELSIGDAVHISDLYVEGVEFAGRPEQTIVTVVPPRLPEVEEEVEVELAEGEEVVPEEGEEGAEAPAAEAEEE